MKTLKLALMIVLVLASQALAAEVEIVLPLQREAYQTNEWIDVSVVRSSAEALQAGDLVLKVLSDNGSELSFTYPVEAVPAEGNNAVRTEHLHINGWLLRPGNYTVEAACDGATAEAAIDVHSHIRKTTFKLIDWGCPARGPQQAILGEDSLGFNLIYGSYGGHDQNANIRGGMDYMRNDALGGAHQMDGRLECDWSDPYVLAGGRARASRQALADRTYPNCIGVHFYDEPGLTWQEHPETGEFTGHGIPSQERAYKAAFGVEAPAYYKVNPDDPASFAAWDKWARWKLAFMDAAWKYAADGVSYVRPDFLSATQSAYAWHAFGDGYYFNVVRSLPVISGHGGYDDYAGGYVNPGLYMELGRIRDLNAPMWYLPTWWGMPSPQYRMEQYLSFMMNLQGMAKPPTMHVHVPAAKDSPSAAIVESNKLMARLGTIFTTMPVTRPDVALLYSMSQNVYIQTHKMGNFQDFQGQVEQIEVMLFASKMSNIPLFPIVEEDVLDGTLAANHKAVILTGIDYLDPNVVSALEQYAAVGGKVILTDDCTVKIEGAINLGAEVTTDIYVDAQKKFKIGGQEGRRQGLLARRPGAYFKEAAPVADALVKCCAQFGVKPILNVSQPQVFASLQKQGDVAYYFLVNATCDESRLEEVVDMNAIKATAADVAFANDGRPVYDVIFSKTASEFQPKGDRLAANLRFGPGQMRIFARTERPIANVQVLPVIVAPADFTKPGAPVETTVKAMVVDDQNIALLGSIPMAVSVVDPLGVERYSLYRATADGLLNLSLPLAANDAAGQWTVTVQELISGRETTAGFSYQPPKQCGALAGETRRALYFGRDRENVYRFFRKNRDITIVTGNSDFNVDAAVRIAENLKPWGVTCTVKSVGEVNTQRELPEEAKATWTGLNGRNNTGFAIDGPAILLGNPQDNPIINYLQRSKFLPYVPKSGVFPGNGRGLIAWQSDGIGYYNQESLTLIAYDAEGMAEAVGSLYEWASGLDPLTRYVLPAKAAVQPATTADILPAAKVAWQAYLPDRAVQMQVNGNQIEALSLDGTLTTISVTGSVVSRKVQDPKQAYEIGKQHWKPVEADLAFDIEMPHKVVKFVASNDNATAVTYWGGLLRLYVDGKPVTQQMLQQDVAALSWQNNQLIAALANGKVLALQKP